MFPFLWMDVYEGPICVADMPPKNNSENGQKTIRNQFRARDGFNALMAGDGEEDGIVLPSDFRGHLHTSITFMRPYALRMQPYALIMHFLPASKKSIKSRAERTSKKPYALYAPLLEVGPFFALFLLRELHTVHKSAYASGSNRALALLPVGKRGFTARRNQKCIRICIRISADFRRNRPSRKLFHPCPSSSPVDAPGVFCP